jgi:plastocyanin
MLSNETRLNSRFACSLSLIVAALAMLPSGCNRRADAGPRPNIVEGDKIRQTLAAAAGGEAAPVEEEAATSSGPAGWATLSGTFEYDGVAPRPAPIIATKDTEVCGKHPLFDESVEVGPNGGLANVVIWVRTPKVPVNPKYEGQANREVVLDNKDCRFEPHVTLLRTSDTLTIKNSDPVGHNSKIDGVKNPGFNSLIPAGQSVPDKLSAEETSPIHVGCSIHPWMGGWVVVRSDPYAAISDKEGHFTLSDLPAGKELEFQLWQEKVGFPKGVEVSGDAKVKVDGKGRFKLKLEPGDDKKLTFKVSVK